MNNFGNKSNSGSSGFWGRGGGSFQQQNFVQSDFGPPDDFGGPNLYQRPFYQMPRPMQNDGFFQGNWGPVQNFNRERRGGGYTPGRGYGPNGPPNAQRKNDGNQRAIRLLLSCGLAKDLVLDLPRGLLKLMKPEHCDVCDISLTSFSICRSHYASKGHAKNQKLWLAQRAELASGRSRKEMQTVLKKREEYCELCDVAITSEAHAESHYSGKPHRSIVEGRKKPRNPFLLKKNMEQRLELILAREKECYKKDAEKEKDGEDGDEQSEQKPVPPELFCNICKIQVPSTEQMTMHLNGKKHLSKEKQHILRLMRGENPDQQPIEEESTKEDNEEKTKKVEEENGDKYDWGNGSGTWDDDPQ